MHQISQTNGSMSVDASFDFLTQTDTLAYSGVTFKRNESCRLFYAVLILLAEQMADTSEAAKRLTSDEAQSEKFKPYSKFVEPALQSLLSESRRTAFNNIFDYYQNLIMVDRALGLLQVCLPEVPSLFWMWSDAKHDSKDDIILAVIQVFMVYTAAAESRTKGNRVKKYHELAEFYGITPLEDSKALTLLIYIDHIYVPQHLSKKNSFTAKIKSANKLNTAGKAIQFYLDLIQGGNANKQLTAGEYKWFVDADYVHRPYSFLRKLIAPPSEASLERSLIFSILLHMEKSAPPYNILITEPGFEFAQEWHLATKTETTYGWSNQKVVDCMNHVNLTNITPMLLDDLHDSKARYGSIVIFHRDKGNPLFKNPKVEWLSSYLTQSGSIFAVVPEKQFVEKFLSATAANTDLSIEEIILFPPELITPKRKKVPTEPLVFVRLSNQKKARVNASVKMNQYYFMKAGPDAKETLGADFISKHRNQFLFPMKEIEIPYEQLCSEAQNRPLKSIYRDVLHSSATQKRSLPTELRFSQEISIFYTKTRLPKQNKYRINAFLCELASPEKQKRNKKRFGKKIKSSERFYTINSDDDAYIQQVILTSFLKEADTSPISADTILGNYPLSDASLKTFWYCRRNVLTQNSHYTPRVADMLFLYDPALGDCMLAGTTFDMYIAALKEVLTKKNEMENPPSEKQLKAQLEIVLSAALIEKLIGKYPSDPNFEVLSDEQQENIRLDNRNFADTFKRTFAIHYELREKQYEREKRTALAKKTWTLDEEEQILQAIYDEKQNIPLWVRLGILIRLFTGLGPAEMCALTWDDYSPKWGYHPPVIRISKAFSDRTSTIPHPLSRKEDYRIIPLVSILDTALKAQKRMVAAIQAKLHRPDAAVDIGNLPIITADDKYIQPCTPKEVSKRLSKTVYKALAVPSNGKYGTKIFLLNFKYRALNHCDLNTGEINYLLGNMGPDTFSRHYCDYTHVSSLHMMLEKLERWASVHDPQKKLRNPKVALFKSERGRLSVQIEPYQGAPAAANVLLQCQNYTNQPTAMLFYISNRLGLKGSGVAIDEDDVYGR